MKFELSIDCDNAAFSMDDGSELAQGQEIARILRSLADRIEDFDDMSGFDRTLTDVNGNRVGKATFE